MKHELSAHRFNMNVDLAGQLVGGTVAGVTGDASVCNMITYMAHEIRNRHVYKESDLGKRF